MQQYMIIFEICTLSPLALKKKKKKKHFSSIYCFPCLFAFCSLPVKVPFSFPSCFSHKNIHLQWQESQSFLFSLSCIFLFNSMLSMLSSPRPPLFPSSPLQSALLLHSRFVPHITRGLFHPASFDAYIIDA